MSLITSSQTLKSALLAELELFWRGQPHNSRLGPASWPGQQWQPSGCGVAPLTCMPLAASSATNRQHFKRQSRECGGLLVALLCANIPVNLQSFTPPSGDVCSVIRTGSRKNGRAAVSQVTGDAQRCLSDARITQHKRETQRKQSMLKYKQYIHTKSREREKKTRGGRKRARHGDLQRGCPC
jgi:hypothetical protein